MTESIIAKILSSIPPRPVHSTNMEMHMSDLSRRSLVTSAAALPVLAVPGLAIAAAAEPDPIFAALKTHRQAYLAAMKAAWVDFHLEHGDEGKEEAQAADGAARVVESDAQLDLKNTVPTTIVGVLALLRYIDEHCTQAIALPEDPRNWHSTHDDGWLRKYTLEGTFDRYDGEPIELLLIFFVARNAHSALLGMSV
jgi:hypothetical protein